MSRPPRPHSRRSATTRTGGGGVQDYLSSEHADFLSRQQQLAQAELGLVPAEEQGDFARTLMDLSAVLAHVLGVYQDRYAREAFLGTARSARSLVRHGRRLGYEPDPGLAAMGFAVLTAHAGLAGWIPRGFALASSPLGEKKAQTYETLTDLHVSAAHNALRVADRLEPVRLGGRALLLEGTGHRLQKGEVVVLERVAQPKVPRLLQACTLEAVEEGPDGTRVILDRDMAVPEGTPATGFRLLAKPEARLRPFAWNAPANDFLDEDLKAGAFDVEASLPRVGYELPDHAKEELFLTPPVERSLAGELLVRVVGTEPTAFIVQKERSVTVKLWKEEPLKLAPEEPLPPHEEALASSEAVQDPTIKKVLMGAVSAVRLSPAVERLEQDLRHSVWLTRWSSVLPLVAERPSSVPAAGTSSLEGELTGLMPGQYVLLSTLDERVQEVAELLEVRTHLGRTEVTWRSVDKEGDGHAWTRGDLQLRGNVVAISHGRSVEQILGDSDGTQPFLRFALDEKPLTYLPGAQGAEPVIEVRVGGVLWSRVQDFQASDADDRHYLLLRDEAQVTHVVFGDGLHGAVPPAGSRHITATYRVGSGVEGSAAAGHVTRIVQAHPLVTRAVNPRPLSGGAAPARPQDIRTQATRFIKTFDRAVSVQDHADLALLFPGVARASAYPAALAPGVEGIRLVVATAEGEPIGAQALGALRSYMELRRDGQVPLMLSAPSAVDVQLSIYLEVAPEFLVEAVRQAVREALHGGQEAAPGLLTFRARSLGQPLHLSELYEVINRVAGVAYVAVKRLDVGEPAPGSVRDTLAVNPDQWLRLRPEHLVFTES
jgi:hypothetical protein